MLLRCGEHAHNSVVAEDTVHMACVVRASAWMSGMCAEDPGKCECWSMQMTGTRMKSTNLLRDLMHPGLSILFYFCCDL